jgi:hypothetical protein
MSASVVEEMTAFIVKGLTDDQEHGACEANNWPSASHGGL